MTIQAKLIQVQDALENVHGCFAAAEAEGLSLAIAETEDARLKDLIERRLMRSLVGLEAAVAAVAAVKEASASMQAEIEQLQHRYDDVTSQEHSIPELRKQLWKSFDEKKTAWAAIDSFTLALSNVIKERTELKAKLEAALEVPVEIPADVREAAKQMQANGYRGPLGYAVKIIDFIADYKTSTPQVPTKPVAWIGNNSRTGVVEICAHTPAPSVLRDFKMRPLVYGDAPGGQATVEQIDAAMVEMANITPPLRRSECARLINAALAAPEVSHG